MGLSFGEKKKYSKAINSYKNALEIRLKISGNHHPEIANIENYIGNTYDKKKEHSTALDHYNLALKANTFLEKNNSLNSEKFFDLNIALETLLFKAKSFQNLYHTDLDIQHLINSIDTYAKAEKIIGNIREDLKNPEDNITFSSTAKEIHQEAIKTRMLLYNNTNHFKELKHSFYHSEKSKANTLKELLNASEAKSLLGLPPSIVSLQKKIKTDNAYYQSQMAKAFKQKPVDSTKIEKYENRLFDLSRRRDSLTEILEKKHPNYYQLKHQNDIITIAEIQKKLGNKTTILEFFTADSITYTFLISKNKLTVNEIATPQLIKEIELLRTAITDKNTDEFKKASYSLYRQLIAPIKNHINGDQLVIIPDGSLWHLNFELLLTKEDISNHPSELSYLLKDYAISYANTVNTLFNKFKNNSLSKKGQECLAFSFSESTKSVDSKSISLATLRSSGGDLPGTRREIKAIADIIDGQYFYGSEAIEMNFKKNANQYNILHLALHGEVDNKRPENSKLFFTQSNDSIEDNLLYSHELFALDIPAELAVLSACNTGIGKIAKGEGIMSLGTAFQYAGTKSLLLSSWEISDKTTPELMKYFYTNLKEGMNKAKALQQAKLQYLNTADINRTHPFYWGGFYLLGNTHPILFDTNYSVYWKIGTGILVIFLLSVFWYQKKKSKKLR
nr:CHAT domain-containing tetratricopeptide repeat protein [Aquimarina sp. RZ0]